MRFVSIPLSEVTSGMIVEFTYTKSDGSSKLYKVIVVDSYRKNDRAKEPQLHAFLIEDLSDVELSQFLETITTEDGLNTNRAYENFKSSNFVKNRSYRTFNISSITSVKQLISESK
jgi:hypothetical protein